MQISQVRIAIIGLLGSCLLAACAPNAQQKMLLAEQNYLSKNYRVSFAQIKSAARTGDADAQYALGYMYFYGKGTAQDTKQGTYWIHKAAEQGQSQAQQALQMLQENSPPTVENSSAASPFFNEPDAIQKSLAQNNTNSTPSANAKPSTHQVTPLTRVNTPYQPSDRQKTTEKLPLPNSVKKNTVAEQHVVTTAKNRYTIQLLDVGHENEAVHFIRSNHLQNKASYYRAARNGKPMYIVTYGQYASSAQARAAIKTLPAKLQKLNPWIKRITKE